MKPEEMDGRIGEAWSGTPPDGTHVNLVIARRGSPTAASIVGALATPSPGHMPFLAVVEPGVLVRPITVVVNKQTLGREPLDSITWGAAQLGISQGVLVAVWLDVAVTDETAVRKANRSATRAAFEDALTDRDANFVRGVAERRDHAANGYYTGS